MSHLTFDLFKEAVIEGIKDYLPESFANFNVLTQEVVKNNDTVLTGLVLRDPTCPGVAPNLYLENFYEAYKDGKSLDELMERIAELYAEAYDNGPVETAEEFIAMVNDFESIREKIYPRLVNKEGNKKRLENLPYTEIADLATIFAIDLGESDEGTMSTVISNEMLKRWEISLEELVYTALSNLKEKTMVIKSMEETLCELMIPDYEDLSDEEKEDAKNSLGIPVPQRDDGMMYVITNGNKTFGATSLLNPEFMRKAIEKIGTDEFYILPSSVHECILVSDKTGNVKLADLEEMVRDVNQTQVAPDEVLSDSVYRYDSKNESIYVATDKSADSCESKVLTEAEIA